MTDFAHHTRTAGTGRPRTWRRIAAWLEADRARWVLWLPVAFGVGIASYFALPVEPPGWIATGVIASTVAAAVLFRRKTGVLIVAALCGALGAGAGMAQLRTLWVAAPVIAKRTFVDALSGRVVAVERRTDGVRLTLDRLQVDTRDNAGAPARVRIKHAIKQATLPRTGDRVRTRAVLLPPPEPATPGGYDFQRRAWFERLGAVGYTLAPLAITGRDRKRGPAIWLAGARDAAGVRIRNAIPGSTGEIAVALLTGDRSGISRADLEAMRESGLAHLLAISGLHIGLAAGFIFFLVRLVLAAIPALGLARPVKKWAAGAALAGALGYMLITGATVPTQRAFLMVGLVLFAVMVDRTALTMRLVAWAAVVILTIAPESLLGASFQLSFAAVVSLIAVYEGLAAWRARRAGGFARRSAVRRAAAYVGGIGLTTLIAGGATGFFAIYHFNRFAAYGLAANIVSVPVTALWIMPWGLLALALMPFGLEAIALQPMAWGIDAVLGVAHTVSRWSGAVWLVPVMPAWGLGMLALGGLWLCLWRARWRWFGLAGPAMALVSISLTAPPDVLVTGDARLMAVRGADGRYVLSSTRVATFAADGWLRRAGTDSARPWPVSGATADGRLRCDAASCLYRLNGKTVALVRDERALAEDCASVDALVSVEPVRTKCHGPAHVIGRFDLWREGGHAMWLGGDEIVVRSVARVRGDRPWVLHRDRLRGRGRK